MLVAAILGLICGLIALDLLRDYLQSQPIHEIIWIAA